MTTERTQDGMIGSADPRIAFRSGDAPGACYASGRTVYDEIFRAGRLLSTESRAFHAMVSSRASAAPYRLAGVDALSGIRDPELVRGRAGALAVRDWRGNFAAAANGVTLLCSERIEAVERVAGGLKVKSPGLVRAVATAGALSVTAQGRALPVIEQDKLLTWMFASTDRRVAVLERKEPASIVTLVRSPGWIAFRRVDKDD